MRQRKDAVALQTDHGAGRLWLFFEQTSQHPRRFLVPAARAQLLAESSKGRRTLNVRYAELAYTERRRRNGIVFAETVRYFSSKLRNIQAVFEVSAARAQLLAEASKGRRTLNVRHAELASTEKPRARWITFQANFSASTRFFHAAASAA
jgi:hypothetical protein